MAYFSQFFIFEMISWPIPAKNYPQAIHISTFALILGEEYNRNKSEIQNSKSKTNLNLKFQIKNKSSKAGQV